ncbi:MAG: 3'(2'),5'-bisphosphate nucleotidase CysQ [Ramlibacter sp.]
MIEDLILLARAAGREILDVYSRDISFQAKQDHSPLTQADLRSHDVIMRGLRELTPDVRVVSEEGEVCEVPKGPFWLVDPLDGTKEFLARNGEFTVNIARIEDGVARLGVVHVPVTGKTYVGGPGLGAFVDDGSGRGPLRCRQEPGQVVVVASRSHSDAAALDAFLEGVEVERIVGAGSSLKFCLLAAGECDLYPRLGPTMEWDTAAAHAVLVGAGGEVFDLEGVPLRYGKPGFRNPSFVARGLQAGAHQVA